MNNGEGKLVAPESPSTPESPFAKYQGRLQLGDREIDCYVLDTGARVISMRTAVKSIANIDSGKLSNYTGVKAVASYIDESKIEDNTIDFNIPGNPAKGKGITAESFLDICSAYVAAYSNPQIELTSKQTEIAMNCAILLSACAKTGLIALIDEATGYQYERAEDALQIKLRAYISEELRAWEKTFPDELWEEFGRLTNWSDPLRLRPKYWGKLVMDLIYDALDPDIANYLKENKPRPRHGTNYHQWMSEDVGMRALLTHINQIIGVAKTCETMQELKEKVGYIYKKKPIQMSLEYFIPLE